MSLRTDSIAPATSGVPSAGALCALAQATGQILWAFQPGEELTLRSSAWLAFTGGAELSAVHPDDRDILVEGLRSAAAMRTILRVVARVRRRDGVHVAMAIHAVPVVDERGLLLEWICAASDISEHGAIERDRRAEAAEQAEGAERGRAHAADEASPALGEEMRAESERDSKTLAMLLETLDQEKRALQRSESRLARMFDANLIGNVFWSLDGPVLRANDAFLRMVGYSRQEHQDGYVDWRKLTPSEFDAIDELHLRAVHEMGSHPPFEKECLHKDGHRVPVLVVAASFPDNPREGVSYIVDLTDVKRAQRRVEVLARTGEILAGSLDYLDYEKTMAGVTALAVPELADWAAFDMKNGDGAFNRLAISHVDAARVALAQELWQQYPPQGDDLHGMPRVVRTGEPVMHVELTDALLEQVFADRDLRERIASLGLQSYLCVPVHVRGRSIGALTLMSSESGRRFGHDDLTLAQEIARRAGIAIENAQSYRDAQEASSLKDEFLATISHELRTPLNAIVGWTRMLLSGKLPPDRQRHALEVIARNSDLQAQLISDLLDVNRAISGKLRLAIDLVDLRSVVAAAIDSVRPAVLARAIQIDHDVAPEPSVVVGDADRLQQIVWNLLSNAIKFSPQGARVKLSLRREGRCIELSVQDWGEGIKPLFLPHVFERFRQADASSARKHGGLGLGLAITRSLVELQGGTISAVSPGPGEGSTFTIRFPSAMGRYDPVQREAVLSDVAPRSSDSGTELYQVRVLILEDDPDTRELTVSLFEQHGAAVLGVANAIEAFSALRAFKPTVLVSDLGIPGEDGLSFVRRMRALPKDQGGETPALALTGYARAEDRSISLAAGFDAFMPKPVDPHGLIALVARLSAQGALPW